MTTFTPASTSTTTPSTSAYTSTKTDQAPAFTPATTRGRAGRLCKKHARSTLVTGLAIAIFVGEAKRVKPVIT